MTEDESTGNGEGPASIEPCGRSHLYCVQLVSGELVGDSVGFPNFFVKASTAPGKCPLGNTNEIEASRYSLFADSRVKRKVAFAGVTSIIIGIDVGGLRLKSTYVQYVILSLYINIREVCCNSGTLATSAALLTQANLPIPSGGGSFSNCACDMPGLMPLNGNTFSFCAKPVVNAGIKKAIVTSPSFVCLCT